MPKESNQVSRLLCPLLTSDVRSPLLAKRSVRVVAARQFLPNTRQTSRGKLIPLPRTPAGFTATAFDEWRTLSCDVDSSHRDCLLSDSCSSGRGFDSRFLQTPPRGDALAIHLSFTSIKLDRGLAPPRKSTCSAHIGIGRSLAAPLLPHHRAYGSVPRRFGWLNFGVRFKEQR